MQINTNLSSVLNIRNTFHGLVLLLFFNGVVSAQFNPKPDSLISKFGPNTTIYFKESSYLFNEIEAPLVVDTVLEGSHLFQSNYVHPGKPYQDLGAFGSSQKAYYLEAPQDLGVGYGYHAWDAFSFSSEDIQYFDTYSPYSKLEYVQGSNGQNVLNAQFSRSAGENFNFGFHFRKFSADRLIGANPNKDNFTDNTSATINLRYQTSNKKYLVLGNYRFMKHRQFETGGYYADSLYTSVNDFFEDDYALTNLSGPESQQRENTWRIYHQYNLSQDTVLNGKVQLFHMFERKRQRHFYLDEKLSTKRSELGGLTNGDFYDTIYFDEKTTLDSTIFHVYENKVGIKGTIGNTYYQTYLRRRDYSYMIYDTMNLGWEVENYFGGYLRQKITDSILIDVQAEFSPTQFSELNKFVVSPLYRGLRFTWSTQKVSPDAIQRYYIGNHFIWSKDLHASQINKLDLTYSFKKGKTKATPFVGLDRYEDQIYYGYDGTPMQDSGSISVPYLGLGFNTSWKSLHLNGYFKYYDQTNDEKNIIRAPEIFWYQQAYIEGRFKGKLTFELGADMYFRGDYDAYAFNPNTQQFHLQDEFTNYRYWVIDAFINFKVKSALLFLKIPHINQALSEKGGYFMTPTYPGVGTSFVFGVEWMFFD